MVVGEPDDLDDSYFSRNIFSLLEMQTTEMDFQLEVQTSIRDITVKVKIKATLHRLGGRFKEICTQSKVTGKTQEQVLEMISKIQGHLDQDGNNHPYHPCGLPSQEVKGGSDEPHQLVRSFNSFLHKELIHICGTGYLV